MNIPLSQIYNYLDGQIDPNSIIYRFNTHGSKNLGQLTELRPHSLVWEDWMTSLVVIMHDQEPLNFDFYNSDYLDINMRPWLEANLPGWDRNLVSLELYNKWTNLNLGFIHHGITLYNKNIICHSELNSTEVEKYSQVGLVGLYWWSHAVIARDWYRYAEVDPALQQLPSTYQHNFNIYNRAWSGSREYRLKFADLLISSQVDSNIKFNPIDCGEYYLNHEYKNQEFRPVNDLTQLPVNNYSATSSADYSSKDYSQYWFDIVLETLYDDHRLHLTEKSLRPIACGKPFMLLATPGSLQYLRNYGFQTFGEYIDESYDQEPDPVKRMQKVIDVMKQLQMLRPEHKNWLNERIKTITEHNKQWFFSSEFFNLITREFKVNYQNAKKICDQDRNGKNWLAYRKIASQVPALRQIISTDDQYRTRQDLAALIRQCRRAIKNG